MDTSYNVQEKALNNQLALARMALAQNNQVQMPQMAQIPENVSMIGGINAGLQNLMSGLMARQQNKQNQIVMDKIMSSMDQSQIESQAMIQAMEQQKLLEMRNMAKAAEHFGIPLPVWQSLPDSALNTIVSHSYVPEDKKNEFQRDLFTKLLMQKIDQENQTKGLQEKDTIEQQAKIRDLKLKIEAITKYVPVEQQAQAMAAVISGYNPQTTAAYEAGQSNSEMEMIRNRIQQNRIALTQRYNDKTNPISYEQYVQEMAILDSQLEGLQPLTTLAGKDLQKQLPKIKNPNAPEVNNGPSVDLSGVTGSLGKLFEPAGQSFNGAVDSFLKYSAMNPQQQQQNAASTRNAVIGGLGNAVGQSFGAVGGGIGNVLNGLTNTFGAFGNLIGAPPPPQPYKRAIPLTGAGNLGAINVLR